MTCSIGQHLLKGAEELVSASLAPENAVWRTRSNIVNLAEDGGQFSSVGGAQAS